MANVEKLVQPLSFRWLKGGQVAGEFVAVENVPHLCLKTWKLSSEFRATIGCLCEGQQFLTEKIIERALDPEALLDPAGRRHCCTQISWINLDPGSDARNQPMTIVSSYS